MTKVRPVGVGIHRPGGEGIWVLLHNLSARGFTDGGSREQGGWGADLISSQRQV